MDAKQVLNITEKTRVVLAALADVSRAFGKDDYVSKISIANVGMDVVDAICHAVADNGQEIDITVLKEDIAKLNGLRVLPVA